MFRAFCRVRPLASRRRVHTERRGAIVVFAALLMAILLGFCAFAVDLGYIANTKTELSRAVDAGALAGVAMIPKGEAATIPVVRDIIKANLTGARTIRDNEITIQTGHWSGSGFVQSSEQPSAVRVVVERLDQPLFFGLIFNKRDFDLTAEAIAQNQPRDIMLTLDFSASMNDDSTFAALNSLGRTVIESNLAEIYNELGQPVYGNMTFTPRYISSTTNSTIKSLLGLTNVPYPYPKGSWDEFINHVKNNSSLYNAGYRRYYGYMTLIHYWLCDRPMYSETPMLHLTSEQPVGALKDATEVFLSFLQSENSDDRLGLSIYNSVNETAVLEHALTEDYASVNATLQARQAGHYNHYTNIGAGLQVSRIELEQRAREGCFRMIVLMTDGIANRPVDVPTAKAFLLDEARLCADQKIPVCTISMGAGADVGIMQQVADITGGKHFNIPGGQTAAEYEEDLLEVFAEIAKLRPIRLVQ